MSKEKEFKKICENWEGWINEQAPRRAGDYVDPDDQQSGYMRTKKGVEKIASIPRPDDELAIPGMNPEAEKELNKKIVKQQTKRGMEYFKSEDQFLNFWNIMAEEWNGNPAASFLFKIPGQKGAPKDYSWGNFAVDLAILAAGVVPPLAGLLAQAGNVVKAGTAAKIAANPKAKALLFAAALRAPKVANKAAAMMDDDVRKHKDFAKYYQRDFGLAMQMAEKEAFRTPYSGNLKPRQIAQLATNDFFNSFRTKSPHYNKGIGARGREKRLRPIILSAFMSAASEVMGAMDTPDRAAGDIPDSPVRKPISPLDTTQQGGMMGKIAQTNRIIKKLGRRIGVRTAADLNDKLARAGYEVEVTGEVTADTIKAVKAFQKEYNMSRARGRRRPLKPDGLFGGKTARAFRRFKK